MKILNIDNRAKETRYNEKQHKFYEIKRKPTYNIFVEMTQEEYQLIAFYLELEKRNGVKVELDMPSIDKYIKDITDNEIKWRTR